MSISSSAAVKGYKFYAQPLDRDEQAKLLKNYKVIEKVAYVAFAILSVVGLLAFIKLKKPITFLAFEGLLFFCVAPPILDRIDTKINIHTSNIEVARIYQRMSPRLQNPEKMIHAYMQFHRQKLDSISKKLLSSQSCKEKLSETRIRQEFYIGKSLIISKINLAYFNALIKHPGCESSILDICAVHDMSYDSYLSNKYLCSSMGSRTPHKSIVSFESPKRTFSYDEMMKEDALDALSQVFNQAMNEVLA